MILFNCTENVPVSDKPQALFDFSSEKTLQTGSFLIVDRPRSATHSLRNTGIGRIFIPKNTKFSSPSSKNNQLYSTLQNHSQTDTAIT